MRIPGSTVSNQAELGQAIEIGDGRAKSPLQICAALSRQLLRRRDDEARADRSRRPVSPLRSQQFQRRKRAVQHVRLQRIETRRDRCRVVADACVRPARDRRPLRRPPAREQQATLSRSVPTREQRTQEGPAAPQLGRAVLEYRQGLAARAARKLLGKVKVAALAVNPVCGTGRPEGRLVEPRQAVEISRDLRVIDVDA